MKNRIVGYFVGNHSQEYMKALDADIYGLPMHKAGLPESGVGIFDFPTDRIRLRESVEDALARADIRIPAGGLSHLYETLSERDSTYVEGHTPVTKRLHAPELNAPIHDVYFQLMSHLCHHHLMADCYVQEKISVRIHQSEDVTPSVHSFYPYYHADFFLAHPPRNYNVYIPITDHSECGSFAISTIQQSMELYRSYGSATALFDAVNNQSDEFSQRVQSILQPVRVPYGQFLVFDSRCLHSVLPMKGGKRTRVSIDARIIRADDHRQNSAVINRPTADRDFSLGAFFRKLE